MAEPTTRIFRRALRLVEAEQPLAYTQMVNCLEGLTLGISAEDTLYLSTREGRFIELDTAPAPDIRLRADRRSIQALLVGQSTLTRSLRTGRIDLRGRLDALTRAFTAFEYFVGALLRMRSAEALKRALQ